MKRALVGPALALGGLTMAVLLLFRALQQTGDSLAYATAIQTGQGMFHPHHLLFAPAARIVYGLLHLPGFAAGGILAGQLHNALWAGIAVGATCILAGAWTRSRLWGISAAALLMGSHGFLVFATQVEVYVPALGAAMLLVLVLDQESSAHRGWLRPALAAACLAMAIFYHQSSVLLCLPLLVLRLTAEGRRGWRSAFAIIVPAGVAVLGVYLLVYAWNDPEPTASGFLRFNLRYALTEQWAAADNLSRQGLADALTAQARSFVLLPPAWRPGLAPAAALVLLTLLGWHTMAAQRRLQPLAVRLMLLSWLAVFYAFFLWWQPGQEEFFVATLAPLILLLVLTLSDLGGNLPSPALRSALALALSGLALGVLLPWHVDRGLRPRHQGPGTEYQEAAEVRALAGDRCTFALRRQIMHTLRYHFGEAREATFNVIRVQRMLQAGRQAAILPLPPERCVVVALRDTMPEQMAQEDPALWLAYMEWLLRLHPDPSGSGMLAPSLQIRRDASARPYALLSAQRRPVADLATLLADWDAVLSRDAGRDVDVYRQWLRLHEPQLSRAGMQSMHGLAAPR